MADLKLKQNGLRFLDSRGGDILLADPRLEMQLLFTSEFLERAKEDPQKMMLLGKKLMEFLKRHTEARWKRIQEELQEIGKIDAMFADKYKGQYFKQNIDALRKCEKDIYFWHKDHAQNN